MRPKAIQKAPEGEEFFRLVGKYLSENASNRVRDAYRMAQREHGSDRRKSGELFFTHPLTVAYYLAKYHLDEAVLAAALLHDVAEDTKVSVAEIETAFGLDVGTLVDGVTKLDSGGNGFGVPMSAEEQRDATLHKLFDAMTNDVRVVLIKLFDRLHNMQTMDSMPPHKQRQKSEEVLSVYAPMANRLGMWRLKNELESLALRYLHRQAYEGIQQALVALKKTHAPIYGRASREIVASLSEANIPIVQIQYWPANVYTTFQNLGLNMDTRYDPERFPIESTLRIVVTLKNVDDCYRALGWIHQMWRPVKGAMRDFIAAPRENLYRALHTKVAYVEGTKLEVRFLTDTMNILAEYGILARWVYKDSPLWNDQLAQQLEMLLGSISENINLEPKNPSVGVKGVVEDVLGDQIMAYTPKGDEFDLPQGATAVDFAYAIHTEVGHHCRGAFVNGVSRPLNQPLADGDRIFIVKRSRPAPERMWLDENLGYIKTSRARTRIRRWFRRLPPDEAIEEGERLLTAELEMLGLPDYPHQWLADMFGYDNPDMLYYILGRAEQLPTTVMQKLLVVHWDKGQRRFVGDVLESRDGEKFVVTGGGGRPLRFCYTCHPRPGDRIVGFVRNDGLVTVHQEACHTLVHRRRVGRILRLNWGVEHNREVRPFWVEFEGYDRSGLMFEILELVQSEKLNMSHVEARTDNGKATILLQLEVNSPQQLVRILHRAAALVNVFAVRCLPDDPSVYYHLPTKKISTT